MKTRLFSATICFQAILFLAISAHPLLAASSLRSLTSGVPIEITMHPVNTPTLLIGFPTISVPAEGSNLEVRIVTSTPGVNIELFMRCGAELELSNGHIVYDYYSTGPTADETIRISSAKAGTYYIGIGILSLGQSITTTLTATVTPPPPPPTGLLLPQFVNGGEWSTTLFLTNLSESSEDYEIRFYDSNGFSRTVPIRGLGSVPVIIGHINPRETVNYETAAGGNMEAGYAIVTSRTSGFEGISGFAIFRQRTPGKPDSEAIVPLCSTSDTSFTVLYDNTNGFETALAIVNPSADIAQVTVTIRDLAGNTLSTQSMTLAPNSHRAYFFSQDYSSIVANRKGSISFTASSPIAGLGLRFSAYGSFTSFPSFQPVKQ